jgi:hypothetical protein
VPHTLPAILRHIAAANRPQSHGAILLREIERLRTALAACTCANHDFEGVICRAPQHATTPDGPPTPDQTCQENQL